ncbi:hypothetical protein [Sphingopyxis sp. H115]|uniref:hypothetical protein n=1 Tax=Sphingopyxis sp. H115 TaxID=1759073 RepID=UPI000736CEAA|nr:hypothetical protein [Sphingopyxis sp. H115]KTE04739.1 hypothetical protein ATE71_19120 [Sphingopyxis sp. H115]
MTKRPIASLAILALALPAAGSAAMPGAQSWEIGPVIRGKNYSQGMPAAPYPTRGGGWAFDFPAPDAAAGHVHYVTFDPGSLHGKSRLVVRYRIDAAPGTRFVPQQYPDRTATVALYMQRRGDSWTAKGAYQYYRWYAPVATMNALAPGEAEMIVRLDDPDWSSVMADRASTNRAALAAALDDIGRIGLVFGSAGGRGHGVFATRPARFTLLSFEIR